MRVLVIVGLGLLVPLVGWAQRYEELALQHSRPQVYHEAIVLPADSGATLLVAFRIPNRMLVFVRNQPAAPGRAFVAEPVVTVQVLHDKQRVDERVWRDAHYAATFEDTQRNDLDLEGLVHFDVPPGTYTYRVVLKDEQADRERTSEPRPVVVPDVGAPYVGAAIPAYHARTTTTHVRLDLVNLSGDMPFGKDALAVLPVAVPDRLSSATAAVRYTLYRLGDPDDPPAKGAVIAQGEVERAAWIPIGSEADMLLGEGTLHRPLAGEAATRFLAPVTWPGTTLPDGAYVLEATLVVGEASATSASRLQTHWRGKPYALHDPTVALQALHFIEDRETVRALQKGPRTAQEARLHAYWAERDPTPATVFNELMAEYYERIDYAAFEFRTGTSGLPNGLRTDRAAVYIVHGPPETVERTFPPGGGVEEAWIYAGWRFVFWAASSLDAFELQRAE